MKELHAVKSNESLSKEQKLDKMKTIRQLTQEELKKILTPEQQAQLTEVKAQAKEEAKENIKERMQKRMKELSKELELTEEQKNTIRPIIEKEMKELAALKNDASLSEEEKIEKMKAIN